MKIQYKVSVECGKQLFLISPPTAREPAPSARADVKVIWICVGGTMTTTEKFIMFNYQTVPTPKNL